VAETTEAVHEVAETCLGHLIGEAVQRAYRRTDCLEQRRVVMARWGQACDGPEWASITNGKIKSDETPLRLNDWLLTFTLKTPQSLSRGGPSNEGFMRDEFDGYVAIKRTTGQSGLPGRRHSIEKCYPTTSFASNLRLLINRGQVRWQGPGLDHYIRRC